MLSVKSLTEMLRFHFCVASFPQERLKDLQGAVTEKGADTVTFVVH